MEESGSIGTVGNYKLIKKIGEGAFGIVYKAIDGQTGNLVAIKKIKIGTEDEGMPYQSLREINILKSLQHPNIVRL